MDLSRQDFLQNNARVRFMPKSKLLPKVDEAISKIVGKDVLTLDPRLIKLITKWKQDNKKPEASEAPDNYLNDPAKIAELKKTFI